MSIICVNATVTFEYDTEDGLVTTEEDAVIDVRDMIQSGDLSHNDYHIDVETEG